MCRILGSRIALLVGNGVNQLGGRRSKSWDDVLKDLAKLAGRPSIMRHKKHKPFALLYEAILATQGGENLAAAEKIVKARVADSVKEIPQNDYHRELEQLGCRHILTTNYDYNLGRNARRANFKPESKYSVFRRRHLLGSDYWMIHGEVNRPNSIMLGYEHYAGAVQKLRNYLYSGKNGPLPYSSPYMRGDFEFEESEVPYSWVDVFLRNDVHILGLGMDYTEIEMWWLLAFKARLRRNKDVPVGTTDYYLFSSDATGDEVTAKAELMKSLGVDVHLKTVKDREYRPHYDWAIKRLKSRV